MSLSQEIVKNRMKIEKVLASKYDVNVIVFAELFQVPVRVIEKEVEGISFTGTKPYNINKDKHALYNLAAKQEEKGLSREEALASVGLWTEPEYFGEKNRNYKGFTKDESARIGKGVQMAKYGYTQTEIVNSQGLNRVEMEFVKKESKGNMGKAVDFAKGDQIHFAEERKELGDRISDITRVNGASKKMLEKGVKYLEKMDKYRKEAKNTEQKPEAHEELKQKTYERWRDHECTQQELAEELGVTRTTIVNWCREGKANDEKRLSEMPTLRQKNRTRAAQEAKEALGPQIIASYKNKIKEMIHSKAVSETAKEFGINYGRVLGVLREYGMVATKFENYRGEKDIPMSSQFYKDAYKRKNKSQFGYGPNAGKSIVFGMSYQSTQKELGFELNHQSKARQHADKHKGDMTGYWSQKKEEKQMKNILENEEIER